MLAACSQDAPATSRVFDPCEPIGVAITGATAEQQASVADALSLWSARGISAFSLGGADGVAVAFTSGNPAVYGYYDDAGGIVYVNADVTDPTQRTVTIAHELGHALGLVHIPVAERASVMNPGNLTVDPTPADVGAVVARWGICPAP